MEVLLEHMRSSPQKTWNAMTPDKKPTVAENFLPKFSRRVKNATSVATSSLVVLATKIFRYGDGLAH
jgi:hypothetical protein